MFTFMFGILGSTIFWIFYAMASLFIGTFLFKKYGYRSVYNYITGKDSRFIHNSSTVFSDLLFFGVCPMIVFYIFWPIVIVFLFIGYLMKFIFKIILWNIIKKAISFADSHMPEISFKIKKEE